MEIEASLMDALSDRVSSVKGLVAMCVGVLDYPCERPIQQLFDQDPFDHIHSLGMFEVLLVVHRPVLATRIYVV